MAQLPSASLPPSVTIPWVPHIPPRTRSWHTSRGRAQLSLEGRREPTSKLEAEPTVVDQPLSALRTPQIAAVELPTPSEPERRELSVIPTNSAENGEQHFQPSPSHDSNGYGTAAWRQQQSVREAAGVFDTSSGLLGDEAEEPEDQDERHLYNAVQDWGGRFHQFTRSYQCSARASAEWSPMQCLAGSYREEQPVQASRQLLFIRQTGDQEHALEHLTVTADGAMEGSRLRPDGNFEQSWYTSRQANQEADGFCQEVPHTTGPLRKRVLSATPNEHASIHRALPLRQYMQTPKGSRAPRTSDYMLGTTFHGRDGRSWNVGVRYSLDSCQLLGFHTERDFEMGQADPSQDVNFAELPNRGMQPAGPRLEGRSSSWLHGRWRGQATSLTFDEDGKIWRRKQHGCIWTPPNNHRREFLYGLWTLPDACYVFAPLQMPQTERSIPLEGVRVECGVMASACCFRRSVMLFDARGRLGKIRFETYERQSSTSSHRSAI